MSSSGDARHGSSLPTLPTGEPVLARWFAILMLVLVPVGIAVIVWAFLSIGRDQIGVAERRPPGTAEVTHRRGEAALNETRLTEPGPGCAEEVEIVGDTGATAAGRRALAVVCQQLDTGSFPAVADGLARWGEADGRLRFAVFEVTGLDSSARVEGDRVVVELNARYQFEDAARAAPFVMHELAHLGGGAWPGSEVTDEAERDAMRTQAEACARITFRDQPPRGCTDAEELIGAQDALRRLAEAGYPRP